jgi:hypothetical protein
VPPFSMRQVPIAAPAVPSPDGSISVTYLSASGVPFSRVTRCRSTRCRATDGSSAFRNRPRRRPP